MQTETYIAGNIDPMPRPTMSKFLNVLTILTIVGCIYACFNVIGGYIAKDRLLASVNESEKTLNEPKMQDSSAKKGKFFNAIINFSKNSIKIYKHEYEHIGTSIIVSILCIAFCLIGAVLMRKLKKIGFFIYLIGEFGLPIYTYILYQGLDGGSIYVAGSAIIAIIFTFLYAMNFKKLVN